MSRVAYVLGGCNNCQLNQLNQLKQFYFTFRVSSSLGNEEIHVARKQKAGKERGGKREEGEGKRRTHGNYNYNYNHNQC